MIYSGGMLISRLRDHGRWKRLEVGLELENREHGEKQPASRLK